jgi:hypothetical protein
MRLAPPSTVDAYGVANVNVRRADIGEFGGETVQYRQRARLVAGQRVGMLSEVVSEQAHGASSFGGSAHGLRDDGLVQVRLDRGDRSHDPAKVVIGLLTGVMAPGARLAPPPPVGVPAGEPADLPAALTRARAAKRAAVGTDPALRRDPAQPHRPPAPGAGVTGH